MVQPAIAQEELDVAPDPAAGSQTASPSVTTISRFLLGLVARQCVTSRLIQVDFAAPGEASKMKNSDASSARSRSDHSVLLADIDRSSRNTRIARRCSHGLFRLINASRRAGALSRSLPWL